MKTRILAVHSALLLGAGALVGIEPSGAEFTDASRTSSVATASPDWTAPTVVVEPLPAEVFGVQAVTATATDRSDLAAVALEYAVDGSDTWTEISGACTDPSGPSPLTYTCQWDTALVSDGGYRVRATASDAASEPHSTVSAPVPTSVDNSVQVDLATIPTPVSGTVALTADVVTSSRTATKVFVERLEGGAWAQVGDCSAVNVTRLACTWDTSTAGNGSHQLRARVESGSRAATDEQADVVVDNAAPTLDALTVPAGILGGTVALAATASDAHSSVASVVFEHRREGSGTWTTCGVDAAAPYACELDTTDLADGTHEIRAVATDAAGNVSSAVTVTRPVSNAPTTVAVTGPAAGSRVRGSVVLTATGTAARGISSVRFQVRPLGGAFADVCSDTGAPYSCSWSSVAIGYGDHEIRAVLTDGGGAQVDSAPVRVTVDNRVLGAADVQAGNGNGTPGAGDAVTLTWSGLVDHATIRAGLSATPADLAGLVLQGGGAAADRLVFPAGVNLGEVRFAQDLVSGGATVTLTGSTISATTVTVAGLPVTQVTVVLGSPASAAVRSSTVAGALVWSPSTAVRDLFGTAGSGVAATETGPSDVDL